MQKQVLLVPHWARGAIPPPPPGAAVVEPALFPGVEHLVAVPLTLLRSVSRVVCGHVTS